MNKYTTYMKCGLLVLCILLATNAAHAQVPIDEPLTVNDEMMYQVPYPEMDSTKLQIKPGYDDMQLKPGGSDTITVTVTNKDTMTITSVPKVVSAYYNELIFEEEWITITPASAEIKPDSKQQFIIEVNIPEDADIGYYNPQVAFTDEMDPMAYPMYIHFMQLSLNVWTPPNIQIETSYIYDRIKAGTEKDYEIRLKNIAKMDISIDPEMSENNNMYMSGPYGMGATAFGDEAISITAPSVVKAGETATIKIHISVPDGEKGTYNGAIDLNIDDPTINEWEGQIQMNFEVWTQPTTPFARTFTTITADPITIDVSTNKYIYGFWMSSQTEENPSFDVTLTGPEDRNVELTLIKTIHKGSVSLGMYQIPPWEMDSAGIYQELNTNIAQTFATDGAVGTWTLNILPKNAVDFEYSITIG
ncbi:MAG TPA: hypothetical protein VMW53_07670 [archaeon]|nr:hypothetical protein [archaeon]